MVFRKIPQTRLSKTWDQIPVFSNLQSAPFVNPQWKFCMHFDTTLPYKIEVGKNILISLRRAVKILCQISGEKNTILKKKKVETVYLSNSTFVTTKTGWLSTDHYLFPSTCYHRKQRIKINRYQKNTILIIFFSCLWIITVCSINIFLCVCLISHPLTNVSIVQQASHPISQIPSFLNPTFPILWAHLLQELMQVARTSFLTL